MQLTAPEIPQPLPPNALCPLPQGAPPCRLPLTLAPTLEKFITCDSLQSGCNLCSDTSWPGTKMCSRLISPIGLLTGSHSHPDTHTHPIAHHTPPHPQHLAQSSTHKSQQLGRHASKSNRPEFKPQLCLLLAEEPQVVSHFQTCFLISKMGLILPPLNSMAIGRKR